MLVRYEPIPEQSSSLKAAWTPTVAGAGVVADISGSGKHGTRVGSCSWEQDPYFGSVIDCFANESGLTFPNTLGVTTAGTWQVWYKTPSLTFLAPNPYGIFMTSSGNDGLMIRVNGSALGALWLQISGVGRSILGTLPSRVGVWTLLTGTYDGDKLRLYMDDIPDTVSASFPGVLDWWNSASARFGMGCLGGGALNAGYSYNGLARAPLILNRALSQDEISQVYTRAKKACWKTEGALVSLADEGGIVGNYLSNTQFQFGDTVGRWRVELDTIEGQQCKVITCKTAGWLYLDKSVMQQRGGAGAFGGWDFWYYMSANAGVRRFHVISSTKDSATSNGYTLSFDTPGSIENFLWTAGAWGGTLWTTVNGAIPVAGWTNLKYSRTVAASHDLLVNNSRPAVTGGSIPATNAAHLSSNYLLMLCRTGDKISIDGSHPFTKSLKS